VKVRGVGRAGLLLYLERLSLGQDSSSRVPDKRELGARSKWPAVERCPRAHGVTWSTWLWERCELLENLRLSLRFLGNGEGWGCH
jgi:hypothetical protein